jgi:hypothetical protein
MASCSALGASQGGALTQLIALGAADRYLSQNPSITFWRHRYNRYTNFAMEAIEQPFNTQVMFGQDTQLTFNRTGDLLYWTYVVIDLPGIEACSANIGCPGSGGQPGPGPLFVNRYPGLTPGDYCDPCGDSPTNANANVDVNACCAYPGGVQAPWAHYTNAIGQYLVRRASLVIGGQVIDTLYNDYLFMWEELSGKPGKRLEEMIGKECSLENLVADSFVDRRLYVPLPFWFSMTNASGNALPVVSLQFHGIQLHVCFADLQACVQTSCNVVADVAPSPLIVVKTRQRTPLVDQDLRAVIESTYVYLDIDERDRFATGSFEQLICQVQAYNICTKTCQVRLNLNFNHPVIELMWAVRRNCQGNANNWFCYSGRDGRDPIRAVSLKLNNLPRFAPKEGRYFRLVQPWQFHTNIPKSFVYCYSFALYPEEPQPSGSCNFSRIDNIELTFDMQPGIDVAPIPTFPPDNVISQCQLPPITGDFTVLVFARNWNVLRYREGLGGLAFSN